MVPNSRPLRTTHRSSIHAPRRSVGAFLVAVFLASMLASAAPIQLVEPARAQSGEELFHLTQWSVGDFWRWDKVPTSESKDKSGGPIYEKVQGQQLVRMEYEPKGTPDQLTKHQSWKTRLYANQTANTGSGPGAINTKQDRFYRVDDHATVRIDAETFYGFEANADLNRGTATTTEMYPPKIELAAPHAAGDKFQSRTQKYTVQHGGCGEEGQTPCTSQNKQLLRHEVLRHETLTLDIGPQGKREAHTFDTWVIVQGDLFHIDDVKDFNKHRYQILWYAPEACNFVQKYEFKADGTHIKSWFLRDFRCVKGDTPMPDPLYSIYDYQNYSSTRKHGALSVHEDYEKFLNTLKENAGVSTGGSGGGGGFWGDTGDLPAPSFVLVASALVALAALVGRTRKRV